MDDLWTTVHETQAIAEHNSRLEVLIDILQWIEAQPESRWESKETRQLLIDLKNLCNRLNH